MSLTSTWIQCNDKKWYENPKWCDLQEDGTYTWFVCLDDDDPPELVVKIDRSEPEIPWFKPTTESSSYSGRYFGDERRFHPARSRFGEIPSRPPPPQVFDEVSSAKPEYMGHWYEY
jgi:hypothetical protein